MTDRHNAYVVILEEDVRDDDAAEIITALKMVRGVLDVQPNVADVDEYVGASRARRKMVKDLYKLIEKHLGFIPEDAT